MTQSDTVLLHQDNGIAVVTLNRPDALNALNSALRARLTEILQSLASSSETEVVILTGAGRAFTAGLDLKELGGEVAGGDAEQRRADPAAAIAALPQPVIGAVNGFAITGGFELALMCDFLIASTSARFADTHARVGVVPGWGLSQRLPRLIGVNRAKQLSLTGNYLDAATALQWGLVNEVVTADQLLPRCMEIAREIQSTDPRTRLEIKRIMDAGWHATLGEGMAIERSASDAHMRAAVRAEDVAGRRSAIQNRGRAQSQPSD